MAFKHKLIAGVATAGAALLLVAVLSYVSMARNVEDRRWVTHTHLVLETLDGLQISMADAETGQFGYMTTGDASYLSPFKNGDGKATKELKKLREFTSDNPNQQRALDHLGPLISEWLAMVEDSTGSRKLEGPEGGNSLVKERSSRKLTEQIRLAIAGMKAEEERLLELRSVELEASSRKARSVIVSGEALGFFFLSLAGLVIKQEMRRRASAEEEVRTLNDDLERKVTERTAELAERAKELERSNMELQQFAYVASHDLQEPLRTISSFTQLLAKRYQDKLDDKAREFINFAVDGCKRMQTLINDLLAFSRVGTQGKTLVPVRCDGALDRVLKSLKSAIDESGAAITREPLPVVLGDEIQLCQLFQNLIGNGIKFRNKGVPKIHISAARNGSGWKISFRDNGIGIAPEHSDRIFVIFQRLHTKMQYPGTGIGLAICKKIAERHGGRIWVEPTEGGGSTFFFTLEDGESWKTKEHKLHELRVSATTD